MSNAQFRWILIFSTLLCLAACGGRPVEALSAAEKAMADASLAKTCAPDEYLAAQKLLEKAKSLAEKGEHARAKATAIAAEKLAKKAIVKAQARKDECLNPQAPDAIDAAEFVDESGPGQDAVDALSEGMQIIYFDYNQPTLSDEAKATLDANADWLLDNESVTVTVEGHCDERGSTEYNLALGEKRAQVARKYLLRKGVDKARISLVSYGEERPADYGAGEAAHKRNRRAVFRANE
ncbi:MAG: peptidoglycan-associated lipoprotein [Myxococcales bacterium]|nr:peptidoglycan-associated lipoprotein [Myxococcales bacterium]|tara:strand:- start:1244 stop:1954 length:711 start_codon:yes stop_codon:yes gene_type:complete